jgi:hypothetical protein
LTKETQQDPFLRRLARALQEWLYTVQGRDHELQQPNDEEKAAFWMDQAVQFSNGLADHDLSLVDEPPEGEAQASSEALEQALQTIREREPDEPAAEPGTAEVTPMVPVDSASGGVRAVTASRIPGRAVSPGVRAASRRAPRTGR